MDIKLKKLNHLMDVFEDYIIMLKIQNPDSSYRRTVKEADNGTTGLIDFRFDDYAHFCNDFWYKVSINNNHNKVINFLEFDIFLGTEDKDRILNSIRKIDPTFEAKERTTWLREKTMYHICVNNLNTTGKIRRLFDVIFEGRDLDVAR